MRKHGFIDLDDIPDMNRRAFAAKGVGGQIFTTEAAHKLTEDW